MFFPIFFSFLQICFLPGFIFYILLNRKSTDPKLLLLPVFSFGLSLIINYVIVLFLTYLNFYTRFALTILIMLEFIILGAIFLFNGLNTDGYNFKKTFIETINEISLLTRIRKSPVNLLKFILFILSVLLLVYMVVILILNTGKVFDTWDAVISWNRWATDFYNNKMPWSTYHYPQLIPANWSIAYVLCKYPLQFIPKMIMHLFLILPVYTLIILGISKRSANYFYSAFFLFIALSRFYWTDGFVDVPVAFFSICVFFSLTLIDKDDSEKDKRKFILLSVLYVYGAAVTKQAGIFIIIIYPLLLLILSKNKFDWTFRKIIKFSLFVLIMLLVIVLPYYIWAEIAIKKGNAASEIAYVTNEIFKGASYPERFISACKLFLNIFSGKVLFVFSIIFFIFSFSDKTIRSVNLIFVIPYFVIWALFFSYDLRNSAIMIPYFALAIGFGLDKILNGVGSGLDKILNHIGIAFGVILKSEYKPTEIIYFFKKRRTLIITSCKVIIIILIPIAIIFFNINVDQERLIEAQNFRVKRLGEEEVNQKLFLYNEGSAIEKDILTDYIYLRLMPEIGKYFQYGELQLLDSTSKILKDENIGFLLWTPGDTSSKKFPDYIKSEINSGSYTEIFNSNGFRFVKIR